MRKTVRALLVGAVCALTVGAMAGPSLAGQAGRVALQSDNASWAVAGNLRSAAPAGQQVTFHVGLGWRNQASLDRVIQKVTDPKSSEYHHYLTPAQFDARFAPTATSVGAVTSWLRSEGIRVVSVPSDRIYVEARGSVAQIERAFQTTLNLYRVAGKVLRAPASAPSVPASLAGIVTSTEGLAQIEATPDHVVEGAPSKAAAPGTLPPPPALFRNAPPCSRYWGQKVDTNDPPAYGKQQPDTECGSTPQEVLGAYTGSTKYHLTGAGQTVAIIDAFASPTIVQDATTWSSNRGLPAPNIQQTVFNPSGAVDSGWWSEESLDVEIVHAMAPKATIQYIGASDASVGLTNAQNYVVTNHVAPIVSNSYGYRGEAYNQTQENIYQMGAATGVGFYFSSGDEGDETKDLGYRTVDWPASSDYVTAVGGTTLGTTSKGGYGFETYWGTASSTLTNGSWQPAPPGNWLYGGGGGTSKVIAEPSYQDGVVPSQFTGYWGGDNRVEPDLSAVADPNTGFEIGLTQSLPNGQTGYSEYRIGGTSLACPLIAGLMSLADQYAGYQHGFANPALYQLYQTNPNAYHDIVSPAGQVAMIRNDFVNGYSKAGGITTSLRTANQLLTLSSIAGFDDSTGMGTPNGAAFIKGLK